MLTFRLACFANEHLAEVLLLDASGSMDGQKFRHARAAATVAVELLAPGTRFAVVAGTTEPRMVYPEHPGLATADTRTRAEASKALRRARSGGGTAIGSWLCRAADLLRDEPGIRHVTLLTDGRDQHESPEALADAVESAVGVFECDCRGVGDDWSVSELRLIATRLLGTVDIVAEPDQLVADFAAVAARVVGLRDAAVSLRVWTPSGVHVEVVEQVAPEVVALGARPGPDGPHSADYPTGAWGAQARSYQLRLVMPPGEVGEEMLAARVSLVRDGDVVAQSSVLAAWTDDLEMSTRMDPYVAHYTGQTQMSAATRDGLAARRAGDMAAAADRLGVARVLAQEAGNVDMVALLDRIVEVEDPVTGRVRLRGDATALDEMTLDTRSTRTTGLSQRPTPHAAI